MTTQKLAPNHTFLFALATLAISIGVTYLVPHVTHAITPKTMAAVYFVIFGAGATAAMLFTQAGGLRVVGSFALGGAGLGIFYYVVIARAMKAAAASVGISHGASASIAGTTGLVFAVLFAFSALGASVAGATFGTKLRKGLQLAPRRA